MSKKDLRVRNWKKYNRSLIQRGNLTLWINEETVKRWSAEKEKGQVGRPRSYSDLAIETCVTLGLLFNFPLRSCQGYIESLFQLLKIKAQVPSYSQVCRRQRNLNVKLRHGVKGSIHVVVDATGLKVYGEGEWKVRQHGYSKRRMWRKLHIGIDVASQEIVMMELTDNHIGENKLLARLLNQYEGELRQVGGDKGYDSYDCHEEIGKRGALSAIEPQKKSKIRCRKNKQKLVRDEITRRIRKIGRKEWKKEVNYHQRSLVETSFFRYKKILGGQLRSRLLENQRVESLIGCNILNRFAQIGLLQTMKTA